MAKEKAVRWVGVDVSARWVDGSRAAADEPVSARQFANTPAGHGELASWLTQGVGGRGSCWKRPASIASISRCGCSARRASR